MDFNGKEFEAFLRSLGIQMEHHVPMPNLGRVEPTFTVLQQSREHEALYRVDLVGAEVQVLVLLPTNQTPLRFHCYLVQWSEASPLADLFARVHGHHGSHGFEEQRCVIQWQLFLALAETMKALFWAGKGQAQFPHEITVHKIL